MTQVGSVDPARWLGDGRAIRIVSAGADAGNRALLEESKLYEWFFDVASRIDIVGIACTRFVQLISNGIEHAVRPGAEGQFEEWFKTQSYIGKNLINRPLRLHISIPSPDSDYIRLREAEGDTECRNKILRTVGRLRCLESHAKAQRIALHSNSVLDFRLVSRNPCFSVFRADGIQGDNANYGGTMLGIIGQGNDAKKAFPAMWIPSHVTAIGVADHLAMLRQGDWPLFRWSGKDCTFTDWTDRDDVFISYNHAEDHVVKDLDNRLRALGVRCFLDSSGIQPGDNWEKKIQAALKQTKCVVICVGKKGLGPWQQSRELVYLLAYRSENVRVIPVWLCAKEDRNQLPSYLADEFDKFHAISFDSTTEFEQSVDDLVRAIRKANRSH